jgi:pimeloyl-ACP methyl ester carboxylesterase
MRTVGVDRPLYLDDGDETVFAVITQPSTVDGPAVVVCPAGGYVLTPQRNRWGVELAHRLARLGSPSIRFDWRGIGDSTGSMETFALDKPMVPDAQKAISAISQAGGDGLVLVGQCYGARTSMALGDIDGLRGLILVSPPVRDHARGEGNATMKAYELSTGGYLKEAASHLRWSMVTDRAEMTRVMRVARSFLRARWRKATARFRKPDPTPWMSRPFLIQLERLITRGLPVLFLYGTEDNDHLEFEQARAGALGELLDRGSTTVAVEVVEGSVHGLDRVDIQRLFLDRVESFVASL